MIIGVAIEEWKIQIFSKVFKKKGYDHTVHPGLVAGHVLLKVEVKKENLRDFKSLVEAAQLKASKWRRR